MTKLEGSGRQKWKKAMTKTGGKRLRVRVAWDGIGWQRMNNIFVGELHWVITRSGGNRCWFRMRLGTAGLFADKKRCGLCEEDRCVLCDREEAEDVLHILVLCDEFQWERQKLLKGIGDIEGSDMWLKEFTEEDHVGKMAMLLGRKVVGCAAVKIENVIMAEVLRWWKRSKELIF